MDMFSGMDNSGQPTIHTTGCSSEVGSANVHLHGGGSWFYNIFDSAIERIVKRKLKDRVRTNILILVMCDLVIVLMGCLFGGNVYDNDNERNLFMNIDLDIDL